MSIKKVLEEEILNERVVRKKVVRLGRWKIVKRTDKPNYKIVKGREVRMKPQEIIRRKKSARKAARKRRAKMGSIQRKRSRSMRKY